jgi:3-oxoacyl-[acyl-carrier protein] reductase
MNFFMTEKDLDGCIALVTGASRGIGRETALTLARAGAIVIGAATTQAGASGITKELKDHGHEAGRGVVLDVNDAKAVDATLNEISKELGAVTILVNNAGITRDSLALRMSEEDWDAVIDTNLKAVFRLSRAVLRSMIKARHGRIINITSLVGVMPTVGQVNYAAAKAGTMGMTRVLAREVANRGVTVNCVAPGFIETDMTQNLPAEYKARLLDQIPVSRFGQPSDVASAVLFLASSQASYITGTTLHVNGGMWMN